jgi:glycosyltransferase involved in cell wall biosynthesis
MYHLISHVVYQNGIDIYGPVHVLATYLKSKKQKVQQYFLPLELEGDYQIISARKKEVVPSKHTSMVVKFIYDVYAVFRYVLKYPPRKSDVMIAVDPLNCFPFACLRLFIPFRLIYYTADYADKRFSNPVLNLIYMFLDRVCLLACDQNWCVSQRIVEKRAEQGFAKKALFVPNTPVLPGKPTTQKSSKRNTLIYVGRMDKNMHLPLLLEATKKLKKKIPSLKLQLIGGGAMNSTIEAFIKKNKLQKSVTFHGPLPNAQVIKQIKQSGIGIALYSGGNHWNTYGDSMKIREYQYFGLPVITTTIPSNATEVTDNTCGHVFSPTKVTVDDIVRAVKDIHQHFSKYTKNTAQLARQRMKSKILQLSLGV